MTYGNMTSGSKARKRDVMERSVLIDGLNNPDIKGIKITTDAMDFHLRYDDYFNVTIEKPWLSRFVSSRKNSDGVATVFNELIDLIYKALKSRLRFIHCQSESLTTKFSLQNATEIKFNFGISINTETYAVPIIKGPVANSPEASDFRAFWGDKSEMRKFADTSICETVVWPVGDSQMHQRSVIEHIVKFVLNKHMKIPNECVHFYGRLFNRFLASSNINAYPMKGTGEEEFRLLASVFEEFSQALKLLEGMPLKINKVAAVGPSLRRTEAYPPLPIEIPKEKRERYYSRGHWLVPRSNALFCPHWCPGLEAQIIFESSGKWPDDLEALRKLKSAFYVQMSDLLKKQMTIYSTVTVDRLYVFYKGFVFLMNISLDKEILLLTRTLTESGVVKVSENEEARQLDLKIRKRPQFSDHISGLTQRFPSYSLACRCFKRWLGSHMLSGYVVDELAELLVAYVYLCSAPYSTPGSFLSGFVRTLKLLASFDWLTRPLIVNLNDELTESKIVELKTNFVSLRPTLPPMCVITPFDPTGVVWTRPQPNAMIVNRLSQLASSALAYIGDHMFRSADFNPLIIFRPILSAFDLLIHLNTRQLPRRFMFYDFSIDSASDLPKYPVLQAEDDKIPKFKPKRLKKSPSAIQQTDIMPVVDYDPAAMFIRDIQTQFQKKLMCFHDAYGGSTVGVVFKPGITVNVGDIVAQIELIGKGLVKSVDRINK